MTDFASDPSQLLGKVIDSPEVKDYFASLDATTKVKRKDDDKRWNSKAAGMLVYSDETDDRINTVFFYADGVERYRQFIGILPQSLSFDQSRAEVRAAAGRAPDASDRAGEIHDTWDFDDYRLVVQYDQSGRITIVCVTGDF